MSPREKQLQRILGAINESDPYTTIFCGCDPGDAEALIRACDVLGCGYARTAAVYGDGPDDDDAFVIATIEMRKGNVHLTAHWPKRPATADERRSLTNGTVHSGFMSARPEAA